MTSLYILGDRYGLNQPAFICQRYESEEELRCAVNIHLREMSRGGLQRVFQVMGWTVE